MLLGTGGKTKRSDAKDLWQQMPIVMGYNDREKKFKGRLVIISKTSNVRFVKTSLFREKKKPPLSFTFVYVLVPETIIILKCVKY